MTTTPTTAEPLLPCPFCGDEAVAGEIADPTHSDNGGHFIQCTNHACGASTNLRFACGEDPRPLLTEQWNRRATPAEIAQPATPEPPQRAWAWLPSETWGQWEVSIDPERAALASEHGLRVVEMRAAKASAPSVQVVEHLAAGRAGQMLSELMLGLEIPRSALSLTPRHMYAIGEAIASQAKAAVAQPGHQSLLTDLQALWPDLRALVDGFTVNSAWNEGWDKEVRDRMIAFGLKHLVATQASALQAAIPAQQPVAWYDPNDFTRTSSKQTEKEWAPLYASPTAQPAGQPSLKSLSASVADALRPFLAAGQKVIWREPFRWHDDNGVMSNHYDGMSLDSLAAEFGYEVIHDCGCAGIITAQPGEKS